MVIAAYLDLEEPVGKFEQELGQELEQKGGQGMGCKGINNTAVTQ